MRYAFWLHNLIPNCLSDLEPMELFIKTKENHFNLLYTHVWGCLVYFFDPKLQYGQKISKWNHQSLMMQFSGFGDGHFSCLAIISHISTHNVSHQYHVVFYDFFKVVLVLTMMYWLILSAIYSLTVIVIYTSIMMNLLLMIPLCTIFLILMKFGWMNLRNDDHHLKLHECWHLAEDCEWDKWIDKTSKDSSVSLPTFLTKV